MAETIEPTSAAELCEALAGFNSRGEPLRTGGRFTKDKMRGAAANGIARLSTARLRRVLQYEPKDLTISVEAGLPYAELQSLLAENRQMIPLDPPLAETATIGGVVAANCSGPRRRLYGTARDLVIGMQFATVEGKLVQSGGMVVKNVAGLDMGKLMIGSFGTLAVIAVLNFKLIPMQPATVTFLRVFSNLGEAFARRDALLKSVLQPAAIDLLNPDAARPLGRDGYLLAVQAGGSEAVIRRYENELAGDEVLRGEEESAFWRSVREFAPQFMERCPGGAVVRISVPLTGVGEVLARASGPAVARAGSGVIYLGFEEAGQASRWLSEAAKAGARGVIEWGRSGEAAPPASPDFEVMRKIKDLMDPKRILNPGGLYGWL
jgi:glycolate oxidase FAD binding subunit